jgi:dimethylamine/trimethylamine dehydrogenase
VAQPGGSFLRRRYFEYKFKTCKIERAFGRKFRPCAKKSRPTGKGIAAMPTIAPPDDIASHGIAGLDITSRDPRFKLLFQPLAIGPVTAKNRFYQVPHCTGMGWAKPRSLAAMRQAKAMGGWAVVCTEYCSIHPSSDDSPYPYATLWDDGDIANLAILADGVHAYGALAGCELWYGGLSSPNLLTREAGLSLGGGAVSVVDPTQTRRMDLSDIRELRHWHVATAKRAKAAGMDVVYVYPAHHYLLHSFLEPSNQRSDAYGGSRRNRQRLIHELISDVKEAVGDRCAIACRWAVDGDTPQITEERREMFADLAELPDLWDLTVADYGLEMGLSRAVKEGSLEAHVIATKKLTTKPVVTVGRYTSPESMLALLKSNAADFIGAARPSIADPFLPTKIAEGRLDDIRECIGCNICYSSNSRHVPIRCTQNPTMGEEWRRDWHPEIIPAARRQQRLLIVGGGPAGLEAARALGQRGHEIMLTDSRRELGGRVSRESRLPGLAEWSRVRDWRLHQIGKLPGVSLYPESPMTVADIIEVNADHVVLATGAAWRMDGVGRSNRGGVAWPMHLALKSADDILAGDPPGGEVLVYDDDWYYLAALIAHRLALSGCRVTLASSAPAIADWMRESSALDQHHLLHDLRQTGVCLRVNQQIAVDPSGGLALRCTVTERQEIITAKTIVPVTERQPVDDLYADLLADQRITAAKVTRIGDCLRPSIIADAVYGGHLFARGYDSDLPPAKRDRVIIGEMAAL